MHECGASQRQEQAQGQRGSEEREVARAQGGP